MHLCYTYFSCKQFVRSEKDWWYRKQTEELISEICWGLINYNKNLDAWIKDQSNFMLDKTEQFCRTRNLCSVYRHLWNERFSSDCLYNIAVNRNWVTNCSDCMDHDLHIRKTYRSGKRIPKRRSVSDVISTGTRTTLAPLTINYPSLLLMEILFQLPSPHTNAALISSVIIDVVAFASPRFSSGV